MNPLAHRQDVAAVDLGSNSFHMLVAHLRNGDITIVDRLREVVRLAGGLNAQRSLTAEIQASALGTLERFGQRLRNHAPGTVRAVGTNTLRIAKNADQFLRAAEAALGHRIEVISGIEEARLIYLGVSRSLASDGKRRLVMDIGGGSTEFIIGAGPHPLLKESLHMGCVSMSLNFFADGKLNGKRFKRAVLAAQHELEPFARAFQAGQWEEAVGSSGTLKSIERILTTAGWSNGGITYDGLTRLVETMLSVGHLERLTLPELSAERLPVFPGGVAILYATFFILNIQRMQVADGALREGLLYDLVGRINHEDIRDQSVTSLVQRYHVDVEHASRVRDTARNCLLQVQLPGGIDNEAARQWLDWAAMLHEIGTDIAHSSYHKHGAYVLEHADLPGFSRQDQKLLALMVRCHRRKFPVKLFRELPSPWNVAGPHLAILLRLAVLLNRGRQPNSITEFQLGCFAQRFSLRFPPSWLEGHPLTETDLNEEADYLVAAGFQLEFS